MARIWIEEDTGKNNVNRRRDVNFFGDKCIVLTLSLLDSFKKKVYCVVEASYVEDKFSGYNTQKLHKFVWF